LSKKPVAKFHLLAGELGFGFIMLFSDVLNLSLLFFLQMRIFYVARLTQTGDRISSNQTLKSLEFPYYFQLLI